MNKEDWAEMEQRLDELLVEVERTIEALKPGNGSEIDRKFVIFRTQFTIFRALWLAYLSSLRRDATL